MVVAVRAMAKGSFCWVSVCRGGGPCVCVAHGCKRVGMVKGSRCWVFARRVGGPCVCVWGRMSVAVRGMVMGRFFAGMSVW